MQRPDLLTRFLDAWVGACALAVALAALLAASSAVALTPEEIERRVEELIGRMTLDEKVGQLNLVSNNEEGLNDDIVRGRVGATINYNAASDIAAAQALARKSRLGIPLLFGLDVLHGFRTVFPVPLAEASAFNPALSRMASEGMAREAAYVGVQWTFAPMVDLSRDPRWGRMVEGSGEDPYLGRVLAAARVEGLRAGGIAAAPKHFAGYGAAMGGRDYDTTFIPTTELRDAYLPPFRAAIDAGSPTIMSAFNALNGVPATANPFLLTQILRKEWGFDGFVISDWAAIQELLAHGIAADPAEAARRALLAGVDMDLMSGFYSAHLANEVRAGRVPESAIDEAARRVLRVKLRLGLFERPDADPSRVDSVFPNPETRRAALAVARESLVLLQNNKDVLPLGPKTRSLALVGGMAESRWDLLGPHAARGHDTDTPTLLERLKPHAERAGIALSYAPGCLPACERADDFDAAVAAARSADAVVAVVGEPRDMSGEAASRAALTLPGRQRELVEALLRTGKPVVLVILGGRPLELGPLADQVSAILMAWYPGTEGAAAVADVLFGDVNPSGKLPVTYPRSVGQLPMAYNRLPTGRPHDPENRFTLGYIDEALDPLFPFGWGLSYTTFAYSDLAIATPRLRAADTVEVHVTLTNTGARDGQEVVQLYVRQPVASRSRPVRELKAFDKIALKAGEARRLTFRVPASELGFHIEDGTYTVEPGRFRLWVGGSSLADLEGHLELTEGLRRAPGQR